MITRKLTEAAETVPLTEVLDVLEASTVGAAVDRLTELGFAVGVDHSGRLCVARSVAEQLRHERAEAERKAAEEAAERARVAAERAAEQEAIDRAQEEARQRRYDRIRRLEVASGTNIIALEQQIRRDLINAPNTGMSYDDRQALEDRAFSLDEIEQWVLQKYGVESLEEITS